MDSANRSGKQERVIHHNLEVLLLRNIDEFFRLGSVARKRLFHENMFAILESGFGEFIVGPHGGDDRDCIYLGRLYKFIRIALYRNTRICCLYSFACCGSLIADPDDLATLQRTDIANNIRAPIAVANDTKPNHKIPPLMSTCSEVTRN